MYVFSAKKYKVAVSFKKLIFLALSALVAIWFLFFALDEPLFKTPYSTILLDRTGLLLGAKIADDEQWRFPAIEKVPSKFAHALISYEDQYFYYHPGFNPAAIVRALIQNWKEKRVVSGASTLTMQVIRLSRNKSRTVWEKLIEMVLSLRLELGYPKDQILALYAAHAPFGGNVVGLEAASWRYFGRSPDRLSWSESAALAVLPNSPSLIYPGKNQDLWLQKRDRVIGKLCDRGIIDSLTASLAKQESLPGPPRAIPQRASHLLERARKEGMDGQRVHTTLQLDLQEKLCQLAHNYYEQYRHNQIGNIASIVLNVGTGDVLAYVGNINSTDIHSGSHVDVIDAPRSTGSILKPFLYAAVMDEGMILPPTLIPDAPIIVDGFTPRNFSNSYEGAVAANEALARSLNIPAVNLLRDYGVAKFHYLLQALGLTTIDQPAGHYGLSLILGGAEATLWELSALYAGMARTLSSYERNIQPYRYASDDFRANNYLLHKVGSSLSREGNTMRSAISAGAAWCTLEAMLDVHRPESESSWKLFQSSRKIAWKTGTSFGFRDAWAIGVTPEYLVGVWVGNADGEGRAGLTGLEAAAPIMFDAFGMLPRGGWFSRPIQDLVRVEICGRSGYKSGKYCSATREIWVARAGSKSKRCPYCRGILLDKEKDVRVSSACEFVYNARLVSWFVLPPVQEWYYRFKNPSYRRIPPFRSDCLPETTDDVVMQFIYPADATSIYVPTELDGSSGRVVFEVAHRSQDAIIYWHLDGTFIGVTKQIHQQALHPVKGRHQILLVDDQGVVLEKEFTVLSN